MSNSNNNKSARFERALYAVLDCPTITAARRVAIEALQINEEELDDLIKELDFE